MSVEQAWNKMGEEQDDELASLLNAKRLQPFSSQNPLIKIKKRLVQSLVVNVLICCSYIALMVANRIWQVQLALSVVLLFTLWVVNTTWKQYKGIVVTVSFSNPLLAELKRHYNSITQCHTLQNRVALFIYPIAAAGGFLLGCVWGSGKTIEILLSIPFLVYALIITSLLMAVMGFFLNKWLYRLFFGKYMASLKKHIDELENGQ